MSNNIFPAYQPAYCRFWASHLLGQFLCISAPNFQGLKVALPITQLMQMLVHKLFKVVRAENHPVLWHHTNRLDINNLHLKNQNTLCKNALTLSGLWFQFVVEDLCRQPMLSGVFHPLTVITLLPCSNIAMLFPSCVLSLSCRLSLSFVSSLSCFNTNDIVISI